MPSLFDVDENGDPRLNRIANQKALTGNAMHWAQISVWLAFVLSCSARVEPAAQQGPASSSGL